MRRSRAHWLPFVLTITALACHGGRAEPPSSAGRATAGYTLVAPLSSTETYLIDLAGHVVHRWKSDHMPGQVALLRANGHLLRAGSVGPMGNGTFMGGGAGGVLEEFDWDGNLIWRFEYSSPNHLSHHDIELLPNGNVLMIAWERKTREEALAAGRDPGLAGERGLWPDCLIEVEPTAPEGGEIVWEWHVWDHLIQDYDTARPHYGVIADQSSRININPPSWIGGLSDDQRERLEALGYLSKGPGNASGAAGKRLEHPDWTHINSVAYNAELDQIALSVLGLNELWIIDHGTTTGEAAGSTGGRYGNGGDLLYRWGNPAAHGAQRGTQAFFAQHDVHWIPDGRPGAGHLLLFNNGRGRSEGEYSSVEELLLPQISPGVYARDERGGFAPAEPSWSYVAPERESFYSPMISGAQRLPSGNTLICSGSQGRLFEVTPTGATVWEYNLPEMAPPFGSPRPDMPARLFEMLDGDGDGQLSREEFSRLPMLGARRGFPGDRAGGGPPAGFTGSPPDGFPGAPPGNSPGGPPGTMVFRALRYPLAFPAFEGRSLEAGPRLGEELD